MIIKETVGRKVFNVFNIVILFIASIVSLYPMLYVLFASLSIPSELIMHTGPLIKPLGFFTAGYKMVFQNKFILSGYQNTIFVVIVGLTVNMFLTSLGAYFLSRKEVMLQKAVMIFILITMYFNGGMIPFFLVVKSLHLRNTLFALILPAAINTFNLIIMRTSFAAIPDSMEESAKMDGASHWTILFRIILPLSKATVAVLILYYGVYHWNAFFNALLFISDKKLFPLQMVLREILIQSEMTAMDGMDVGAQAAAGVVMKYATIIVATVPILTLYPFMQKYFTKGLMIGAVKG